MSRASMFIYGSAKRSQHCVLTRRYRTQRPFPLAAPLPHPCPSVFVHVPVSVCFLSVNAAFKLLRSQSPQVSNFPSSFCSSRFVSLPSSSLHCFIYLFPAVCLCLSVSLSLCLSLSLSFPRHCGQLPWGSQKDRT